MTNWPLTAIVRSATDVAASASREDVNKRARLILVDTLGVICAAGGRPSAVRLVDGDSFSHSWRVAERSEAACSRVLISGGGWAAPERAAFVNASIACDLELDEGMRPTGHPAIHILPALIATGEIIDADVDAIIAALLVGYEVAGLLFTSFKLRNGVHPHGHLGAIAAAAAVAHLRGVDPEPPALVAATLPLLTTWPPCLDGATVRNTWAGHAASMGILAQRYADAGWKGSSGTLDTAFDGIVADLVASPFPDPERPQILNSYFKLNSACALTHAAIEAARSLFPLKNKQVKRVLVRTTANNMKVAPQAEDSPLSRRFSIPFAVATALIHGDAAPHRFDNPDQDCLELAARVNVEEDPRETAAWPEAAPARVSVWTTDGSHLEARCDNAPGTPALPATDQQLQEKFATLTSTRLDVWADMTGADGSTKISKLLGMLNPA
jgi:2-methylcitrate dehydratase PrpD